ncbi:MAG: putative metallopeptidase [Patescibacteria group bacterium]|jgi:predicted metallopeptidase
MEFVKAPDIQSELSRIIIELDFSHIKPQNLVAFRSFGSSSRAIARIWSLPKIWQMALNSPAHYCIEVISERFDKLSFPEREKVLIHELLHIPKNFSGALLPHKQKTKRIDRKTVDSWHAKLYNKLRK